MTQQSQPRQVMPKLAGADYFSLIKEHATRPSPPSAWPRQHRSSRVALPLAHSFSSSSSSGGRASWSSLFNTGSVRQFMSGVQDTLKEGLTTPLEIPGFVSSDAPALSPMDKGRDRMSQLIDTTRIQRKRRKTQDSVVYSPTLSTSTSKSSNENISLGWPGKSSPRQRRIPLTQVADPGNVGGNAGKKTKMLVFDFPSPAERYFMPFFDWRIGFRY